MIGDTHSSLSLCKLFSKNDICYKFQLKKFILYIFFKQNNLIFIKMFHPVLNFHISLLIIICLKVFCILNISHSNKAFELCSLYK